LASPCNGCLYINLRVFANTVISDPLYIYREKFFGDKDVTGVARLV